MPSGVSAVFAYLASWLQSRHNMQVVHFNITEHPTAKWTAQELVEVFPWDSAPRYLLRDRDSIYNELFQQRVAHMGIEEVKTAPRSPWQLSYVERLIGSSWRECLNNVIVLNERHLHRMLGSYVGFSVFADVSTEKMLADVRPSLFMRTREA